jgi:hypothetical protein
MTRTPPGWGHELERAAAARHRRELVTAFLVAVGMIVGALLVLIGTWCVTVYVLTLGDL